MDWKVPLTTMSLGEEEKRAASRVIDSGWLSMGPEVSAFEKEFAEAVGSHHAVAVSNATDGLAMCYDSVGVDVGEEIAMPALTFVACLNVALRRNERPLLIDIVSEDDLTLSPNDLEQKLTPRTRLVVTMPYGGFAPQMEQILSIAHRRNIPIIEDACHGVLGSCGPKMLGTFGDAGVFSFFSNKNMTTGEGGMIVTNDRTLNERLRLMRSHGMTRSTMDHYKGEYNEYDVIVAGHNFRMDEIRAAIGREQLRKLPALNRKRGEIAVRIKKQITARCPDIKFPFSGHDPAASSHHLLPAILPKGVDRANFMSILASKGVQTSVHYKPLHRFKHTLGLWEKPPHLPVLESIENRLVTLPLGPGFTDKQVDILVNAVVKAV